MKNNIKCVFIHVSLYYQEKIRQVYLRVEQCDSDLVELKQTLQAAQEEVTFYKKTADDQTTDLQTLETQYSQLEEQSRTELDRCKASVSCLYPNCNEHQGRSSMHPVELKLYILILAKLFPLFVIGTTLFILYECSPFWVGISTICIYSKNV